VSHPSLGLPPRDPNAGLTGAAARVREHADRLGAQALRVALDRDPSIAERHDEAGQRHLLNDATLLAERLATTMGTNDVTAIREYAEWTAPHYRRRRIAMDDLIGLCEGLRASLPTVLAPTELPAADRGLDAAIKVYKWHRRIAGDARKRNALLQFLYKGA
jgi:hypothetical protein